MTGQPQRLLDLFPEVVADLAQRHRITNGEPPPMTTIWRYPLPMTDRVTLDMPKGARLLAVGPYRGPATPGAYCVDQPLDLWAVVDPTHPPEPRTFLIVGTGRPMPTDAGQYVGTTHSHGGEFIWHVFEAGAGEVAA